MLRLIGLALAAPFFLVLFLGALVAVVVDFTIFRLRALITGEPHLKGLWEF
jgi:hypothetical protein